MVLWSRRAAAGVCGHALGLLSVQLTVVAVVTASDLTVWLLV